MTRLWKIITLPFALLELFLLFVIYHLGIILKGRTRGTVKNDFGFPQHSFSKQADNVGVALNNLAVALIKSGCSTEQVAKGFKALGKALKNKEATPPDEE